MSNSWLYVPGLAVPDSVVQQANSAQDFQTKIERVLRGDPYMQDMVQTLLQKKGATPLDCRQALCWIEIPQPPVAVDALHPQAVVPPAPVGHAAVPNAKAFKLLGLPQDNLLAKKAGTKPRPVVVKYANVGPLPPCSAPQYIAQAMPASAKTRALARVGKGDTLYLVGHANPSGAALMYKFPPPPDHDPHRCGGWEHSEKRHVDPVTLASLLINEGLPSGVKFDVVLVACFSAGVTDPDRQTVQSLAQRLAGTLFARGYECRVFGSMGFTSAQNNEVRVAEATASASGELVVDHQHPRTLPDSREDPFYQRFFRGFAKA